MRGADAMQESLFTVAKLDDFVPADHPLRSIRVLVNDTLMAVQRHLRREWPRLDRAREVAACAAAASVLLGPQRTATV